MTDEPLAPAHPGLEAFRKVNADLAQEGRRLTATQRAALLREQFPTIVDMVDGDVRAGWLTAMDAGNKDEILLLGMLFKDMAEHDQAVLGKPGPKPGVRDAARVHEMLRQFAGEDHTTLPFHQILPVLQAGRSIRALASKTGIHYTKIFRICRGQEPSRADLEAFAKAFRKHPSYFLEYRVQYLQADLARQLEGLPEASIDLYRRRASQSAQ